MKVIIVEDVTSEDLPFLIGKINTEAVVKLVQAEPATETPKQEEAVVEEPKQDKPVKEEKPRQRQHKSEEKAPVEKAKEEKPAAEAPKAPKEEKAVKPEPVEEPVKETETSKVEKKEEPKQEEAPKETEKKEATPQVSRTDVINLGKKLVKEGHGKDVSKLMKDTYNATKFSDISDDQLPEVYKAFKEIEDAA